MDTISFGSEPGFKLTPRSASSSESSSNVVLGRVSSASKDEATILSKDLFSKSHCYNRQ